MMILLKILKLISLKKKANYLVIIQIKTENVCDFEKFPMYP